MTTTPTLWGTDVTFSSDILAFNPKVVALSDGTFAIAWENDTDLFGRHLNELGSFTGGNFLQTLSANTTKAIHGPQIFEQADGRLVVDYRLQYSATDTDIYWHSADLNGFPPSGNAFGTEKSPYDEFMQDATALAAGGSALAYQYNGPGNLTNLVIRFVDAFGNQASNQIFVDPSDTRTELNPALAKLGSSGNVMVAYESFHFDPNPNLQTRDIRLHTYSPDGTDLSGEVIVSAGNVNAGFPDVVALEGAGFFRSIVCWQQADGIAYRSYFANLPIDPAPKLIAGSGGGLLPKITALKDGGFIIAWTVLEGQESDGSPDLDITLQRFDREGTAIGSRVDIDKPGDQGLFGMSIATLEDGRVIVTYGNETGDATNITTLNYQMLDPREHLINATSGNDNYVGREDGSTINGFNGNDKLTGREFQDFLNGGQGNDILRGFGGDDVLDGGTEADSMSGGQGNDLYRVDNANDVVTELANEGTDNVGTTVSYALAAGMSVETLRVQDPTTTNAINLYGNEVANTLIGNNGANALNGRGGVDTMRGLDGNDTYVVDMSGDKVFEVANQGTDTVRTTVTYALAAGQSVEILRVDNQATTNAINLVGNEVTNQLMGNNGANAIDGKAGADVMRGFLGNDIYVVDNAGDHVIELANQGTDTVRTTTSFTLESGMSIETLRVHDPASINTINLTGNQVDNVIIGNNGANVINGKAGNDTLIGSGGNDFFQFDTALNASTNVDTITAYSVAADTVRLENAVFSTLAVGVLNADAFHIGASAVDAEDRIVYNSATGGLFYDANGNAAGGVTQFAKLAPGIALTNADFVVI